MFEFHNNDASLFILACSFSNSVSTCIATKSPPKSQKNRNLLELKYPARRVFAELLSSSVLWICLHYLIPTAQPLALFCITTFLLVLNYHLTGKLINRNYNFEMDKIETALNEQLLVLENAENELLSLAGEDIIRNENLQKNVLKTRIQIAELRERIENIKQSRHKRISVFNILKGKFDRRESEGSQS